MHWVRRRGVDLTLEEVTRAHHELSDQFGFDRYRDGFGWVADQLGDPFAVESIEAADPLHLSAVLVAPTGRRWEWVATVAPEPPHAITNHGLRRALPPGVTVRPARPADAAALRDVARRAPIRLTDATIAIDPGDDYFAACRLMGDTAITFVATHDEVPIGIHCGVSFPVRLQGTDGTCCLIAHSRLLPEHSGGGIWGRLNDAVFTHFQGLGGWQVPLGYVRPDNAAAQRLGGAEARWSTRPFRAVINGAEARVDDAGAPDPCGARPATEADAAHIVEILNSFHGNEEFFVPYTQERLERRLTRAPELYSWADLTITERAVVGVWASGDRHTYVPDDGEPRVTVRAVVLDYGCLPGAEDELISLLRRRGTTLLDQGITHLGVFTSPASPASAPLRAVAEFVEEYDLMPPGIPEPPTVAAHGVYVDPVYF